jgi:hypothetical protein
MPGITGPERNKVVVRYRSGRVLKGYTHDFSPSADTFHLTSELPIDRGKTHEVTTADLKAVFFVKTLEGNKAYHERKTFNSADSTRLRGLKMKIEFEDGEVMRGTTLGYSKAKKGFFIIPVDPKENNDRIYVLAAALRAVATGGAAEK